MKLFALGLLIFATTNALALDAVVTVLEAPMFKEKDINSPVVQYLRKGEVIKLHSSVGNTRAYDHLAPSPEKQRELKEKIEALPEWRDPLFKAGKETVVYLEDQFLPTFDRLGNLAWVLTDHLYIYFGDSREFQQAVIRKDPTDYRLEEPLPRDYPFYRPSGYRGQLLLGVSQPYNESYPYPDRIKSKGYANPFELNVSLLWQRPDDTKDRFFYGGNLRIRTFESEFSFFDFRTSRERYTQLGLGPLISYDAYKGEKNRLNLSFSINFNPLNQLSVSQTGEDDREARRYRAFNFSSRFGIQYHRKNIVEDLDFVLGTSFDAESPAVFQAQDGGGQRGWWQNIGGEKFTARGYVTLTGFLGIQAAY